MPQSTAAKEWYDASKCVCSNVPKMQVSLAWDPPIGEKVKLNVDGSQINTIGNIGAGVLRDNIGHWLGGFSVNLGKCQVVDTEIWGLYFGLKLTVDKSFSRLCVEMDSALVVNLINNMTDTSFHPLANIIDLCRQLMTRIAEYELVHVYREKNMVADDIANWSYNMDLGYHYFENHLDWIGTRLFDDMMEVPRTRIICNNSLS